ncbi:MAG: hypothetical protein NC393_09215 [Clostridium sp.]|nr:hypothetical protein [Clostridium sp.]MCM1172291.1 hypothetical protein [Clostridium sp.]MCM1208802.1 hypothetical protein [Ruminococcus sp.]
MEFIVNTNVLRNCGNRISDIADISVNSVILSVSHVMEGIEHMSVDLALTMENLITDLKITQNNLKDIAETTKLIANRYDTAEMNIMREDALIIARQSNIFGNMDSYDLKENRSTEKNLWDRIKLIAKILGMSFRQTLNLFLDLVQILGNGLWEAGTGWLDGGYDWEQWLYEYVPNHVNDASLLAILSLLSINPIPEHEILEHYQANLTGWETYLNDHANDAYIEHQSAMLDIIYYGNHTAEYNSCEVIATYNALLALNNGESPVDFPMLLSIFEAGGIVLGGEFGTSPIDLYLFLDASGYDAKILYGGSIKDSKLNKMQSNYTTYILTAYNDADNLGEMIHTVSITKETLDGQEKYVIHNAGDCTQYDSLADAVKNYNEGKGEAISVIGVR